MSNKKARHLAKRKRKAGRRRKGERSEPLLPPVVLTKEGEMLELVDHEIVYEAMDDPNDEKLKPGDRELLEEVEENLYKKPGDFLQSIRELIEKYPHIERFHNYLLVAYQDRGDGEMIDRTVRSTYEKFPDYLFAKVNYVRLCIRERRLEDVPAVLNHKRGLHQIYPRRRRFHITEWIAFHGMMGEYLLLTGEKQAAERYHKMMRDVAPDHPETRRLAFLLHPLRSLFGR